jgi:sterol desaturase/sphingolipid hydroxylase (fatty acid hydroxylase superfamily)
MPTFSVPVRLACFSLLLLVAEATFRTFDSLRTNLPLSGEGWVGVLANNALWMSSVILFSAPLLLLERFLPHTRLPRHYGRALLYWVMYIPLGWGSSVLAGWLLSRLGMTPLLSVHLDQFQLTGTARFAANVAMLVLAMVCFDFFYYWLHRMQHRWAWLWRFHQVHHANRYVNALSCYHHPLEDLLRIPLFTLPMALTFSFDAPQIVLLSAFFSCWAYWNHMDSQLHFGVLRHVLVDNRYHMLHHSMNPAHFDRNFASYFTPWDRLFGTQLMPDETAQGRIEVGLDGVPSPASLKALWLMPLKG